jgi:hypothetical protein
VQPHIDAAPPQRAQRPLAEPLIQLRQDPAGRLDQHPAQPGRLQRRVEPHRLISQALQLGQRLDPGEPAAYDDERERGRGDGRIAGRRRHRELAEHVVAQMHRLGNGLEPGTVVGQPLDRQHPRHRPGRHHQHVILQHPLRAVRRREHRQAAAVINAEDRPGQQPCVPQHPWQRRDHVPRLDRSPGRFGQQRLIGHVPARVHHGHRGLAGPQQPLQLPRRVHPDVTAAHNQDLHDQLLPTGTAVRQADAGRRRACALDRLGRVGSLSAGRLVTGHADVGGS